MNIKTLCFATVVLTAMAQYACAADGTLTFKGNITNSSCSLQSGTGGNITVPLGSIPKTNFKAKNDLGPKVGFTISVTGCTKGTYYLVLDGTTVENEQNVLALDSTGEGFATGVGVQVSGVNDAPITISKTIDPSDASITVGDDGAGVFLLKANYIAIADEVDAGTANATAHFTIIQQ